MTEVSKSRRGFLGLLVAAPVIGPAIAKAAMAAQAPSCSGSIYASAINVEQLSAITSNIGEMVPGFYFSKPGVDALVGGPGECIVYDGKFTRVIDLGVGSISADPITVHDTEGIPNRLAGAYINEDGDAA